MPQNEAIAEVDSPRQRGRRNWLFSGPPPSGASVMAAAFLYGAFASWVGTRDPLSDLAKTWQESPLLYAVFLLALTVIFSLFTYAMLRIALPLTRPRVTKRWRSEPLVMRTFSLAQSIITFQTLNALPALMIGLGLGTLLTAIAGVSGIHPDANPAALLGLTAVTLASGVAGALGRRHAARSGYKAFLLDGLFRRGSS